MQVRLGTRCGLNLVYVTHWAFAEVEVEPPPPPPPPDSVIEEPTDAAGATEDRTASTASSVPPPSSPPPTPAPVAEEGNPPALPDCTLTLYLTAAEATPLVFHNEDARAVLGVLVAQSGSLT